MKIGIAAKLALGALAVGVMTGVAMAGTGHQAKHHTTTNPKNTEASKMETITKPGTIVETAIAAGSFKTLVAAVKAAGLAETLNGAGPFTVFAPTDEAFAKLPKGTVENLLKPENVEQLRSVLTYHVVAGKVMAADVVKLHSAKTVQGQEVSIKVVDGAVMVDGAKVIKADVAASNGVIHVIDTVILPKSK